ALLTAEDFLGQSPFVMYLGDNLLRDGIVELAEVFRSSEPDALILLTHVEDPSSYGVAELDGDRVVRLVEKPKDPPSDLALVGVYMFGPSIFEAAHAIEPSDRGELESAGTRISDSYIGPYTAIDHDVVITGSEVEHSIVLSGSSIRDLHARMEASLLGKNVSLSRSEGMPKTLRFLVGDNADISIP